MNKKGFTTIELLLTMLVVVTIMASITAVTYTYRDRGKYEETLTQVNDYKNMVTKIIYDDIVDTTNPLVKIEKIDIKTYKLTRKNNTYFNLEIMDDTNKVGIKYNGIEYVIPDSTKEYITFEGTTLYPNDYPGRENTGLYGLDIVFSHRNLEDEFKIHFVIDPYKA